MARIVATRRRSFAMLLLHKSNVVQRHQQLFNSSWNRFPHAARAVSPEKWKAPREHVHMAPSVGIDLETRRQSGAGPDWCLARRQATVCPIRVCDATVTRQWITSFMQGGT
jgi:hypothetical protein